MTRRKQAKQAKAPAPAADRELAARLAYLERQVNAHQELIATLVRQVCMLVDIVRDQLVRDDEGEPVEPVEPARPQLRVIEGGA